MTAPEIVVSAATVRPTPCLRCGRPIRVDSRLRVTTVRHPSLGEVTGLRHDRCPIILTARGRFAVQLAICAVLAGLGIVAAAGLLAHWPALRAAMRLP